MVNIGIQGMVYLSGFLPIHGTGIFTDLNLSLKSQLFM